MKKIFLLLVVHCAFCIVHLQAQVDSIIYQCDFEDPTEYAKWEENAGNQGASCANKWYFGKPGSNGGEAGLFVSKDGVSNNYEASALSVVAFRTLDFLKAGEYEFSFDWRAAGWQDSISNVDGLYVCWVQ